MPYVASATPPVHVLLNPFAWVFWGLDFALWLLIPPLVGPIKMITSLFRGKYSKEEKTGQRINARYEDIISRAGGEYELITADSAFGSRDDLEARRQQLQRDR